MGIIRSFASVILIGFILTLSAQTRAAVLDFDEAIDGDIDSGVTIFMLDFGTNTVRGTVSGGGLLGAPPLTDFDLFQVTVPVGGVFSVIQLGFDFAPLTTVFIQPGIFSYPQFKTLDVSFGMAFLITDVTPFMGTSSFIGLNTLTQGSVFDYTITLEVFNGVPAVIPLPAALPLYGTGLAVMGFLGWRRKRRAAA